MTMTAGEIHNYVDDIRTVELAVVDPSGAKDDEIVVVPKSLLLAGGVIHDENLPVDAEIVRFMQNASIQPLEPGQSNPATTGLGKTQVAVERRAGAGTDTDSKVDRTAAYVQLLDKQTGKPLGTYLLSVELNPETVTIDGKPYELSLRFKRNYKPYSIQLLSTDSEVYVGTSKPRTYSSDVHLVDPTTHADRDKVHISMNNPLRYGGETFYQSGFVPADKAGGVKFTTLSVVTNQGWMIPYLGCMIVLTGLAAHFCGLLMRFLRRQQSAMAGEQSSETAHWSDSQPSPLARASGAAAPTARAVQAELPSRSNWSHLAGEFFPWIAVAVLAGWAGSKAIPPRLAPDAMNLYEFGKIPVEADGRVKPLDTLARNSLWAISDKQTYLDSAGQQQPAIEWLLRVITGSKSVDGDRVFHIASPEMLSLLGLEPRKGPPQPGDETPAQQTAKKIADEMHGRNLYSLDEMRGDEDNEHWNEFSKQVELAREIADKHGTLSPYQTQVLEVDRRLNTLLMLQFAFNPLFHSQLPSDAELKKDPQAARKVIDAIRGRIRSAEEHDALPPLPRTIADRLDDEQWEPYSFTADIAHVEQIIPGGEANPRAVALGKIFQAYKDKDSARFNAEVNRYRAELAESPPKPLNVLTTDWEAFFNHAEPFYNLAVLYFVAFLMSCFALLGWSAPLGRAAFWLIVVTLILHTAAEIGRISIAGRPPVTNLYSAALFIGWASVLAGLLLEVCFRLGVGTMVAGAAGFVTLLIAHFLASSGGDTVTVMEPVLDTQFWLATHVTCVCLGYAATFVAGLLGLTYVVRGVATPSLTPELRKDFSRMIYGTVCFAILFSFVGTVLGGLWADNSWGRFWGWDPKENGALIIVIWNALVLHARWGGMVKERGLAVLAVGGIIAVAWSGFGVNELGVGLHAYGGSTAKTVITLLAVGGSQLAIIAIGALLPKHYWASFRAAPPPLAEIVD